MAGYKSVYYEISNTRRDPQHIAMDGFTVYRMLINQNAVVLPENAVSLCKQYDHVIMLSKNQSALSPGSHLIKLCANTCKFINHGIKPSGQQ